MRVINLLFYLELLFLKRLLNFATFLLYLFMLENKKKYFKVNAAFARCVIQSSFFMLL